MTDRRKKTGFTVIELLIVVVVIVLVAGAAGGIYLGTHKRMMTESGARGLALMMKYARLTAIERQTPCRVYIDRNEGGFFAAVNVFDEQSQSFDLKVITNEYCKPATLKGNVKFEKIMVIPYGRDDAVELEQENAITFNTNGTSDQAVIQIGDGKNQYSVVLSPACGTAEVKSSAIEEIKTQIIDLDAQL